jgi:hypothetical protein
VESLTRTAVVARRGFGEVDDDDDDDDDDVRF